MGGVGLGRTPEFSLSGLDQFPLKRGIFKVGLTGGIGCGKTTIAGLFAERGVPVIDADQISRQLVESGQPALNAIAHHFGPDLLIEGRLNRSMLRERIFSRPDEKEWLENLLHPLIYGEMERQAELLSAPYCLLVVPLLLETGHRGFVDRLLVVDCPVEIQRQRIRSRDGLDEAVMDLVLAAQLSRQQRLAAADDILENVGPVADLQPHVEGLHKFYRGLGMQGDHSQIIGYPSSDDCVAWKL